MNVNNSVETYAPMFLGFWSLEFLKGWMGLILTTASTVWVVYQLISRIVSDIRKRREK